jgi:L-lysine 2,3-aminomutase
LLHSHLFLHDQFTFADISGTDKSQAEHLQAAMQQTIMDLPPTYARRILNLSDPAQAHKILKQLSISLLNELRNVPQKVVDPNWLRTLEKDEGK